jgi:hypothetical protein
LIKENLSSIESISESINSQCSKFSRKLRSLSLTSNWKATEWKNWLFYFSIIVFLRFFLLFFWTLENTGSLGENVPD